MEFGTMIRQAWTITWRYRFLWILAILAGGAVGLPNLGNSRVQSQDRGPSPLGDQIAAWASANAGLVVALGAIAVALTIALLVVSFIAQGGMAQATADLATGHTSSLGRAWGAGVHLFWRYVGLWLMLAGAALAIAAVVAAIAAAVLIDTTQGRPPVIGASLGIAAALAIIITFVAFVLRITRDTHLPRALVAVGATIFALPIFTVLTVAMLTLSVVVAFAQRAIAVEDVGPLDALRSGWRLTRTHVGESLLTWLVNVGLAIATVVVAVAGLIAALIVLAGVGAMVFALAGSTAPMFAYIGLGGMVLLAAVLTLTGIANTFFWAYWTLAYLRLSGRAETVPSPAA